MPRPPLLRAPRRDLSILIGELFAVLRGAPCDAAAEEPAAAASAEPARREESTSRRSTSRPGCAAFISST